MHRLDVDIDNLIRHWQLAEQSLLALIHYAYVPVSDMTPAGKSVLFDRLSWKWSSNLNYTKPSLFPKKTHRQRYVELVTEWCNKNC